MRCGRLARTRVDRCGVGARAQRPALAEVLNAAAAWDTLVVCRLDRLQRSLPEPMALVENLTRRGVGLGSLVEQIDIATAAGRLVPHVFAALAEFERALMRERTMVGLAASRARGRVGVVPVRSPDSQLSHAELLAASGKPVREIAEVLKSGDRRFTGS
jgi:DNA invertase Pin-like site-specific DNA recombinase